MGFFLKVVITGKIGEKGIKCVCVCVCISHLQIYKIHPEKKFARNLLPVDNEFINNFYCLLFSYPNCLIFMVYER